MDFLLVGISSFLIIRMWFEKAIVDFNKSVVAQGQNGPQLVAAAGNGFTSAFQPNIILMLRLIMFAHKVVWIAYAFYAVPLIASLAKINVNASDGKSYE
jgi:hypothetical protein